MKQSIIFIGIASALLFSMGLVASAAPTSTYVQNLFITGLAGGGTECLHILNSGLVQVTPGQDCGSGGGASSTLIYAGNQFLLVQQSGSNATLTPASVLSLQSSTDISWNAATGTNLQATFLNPKGFTTTTIQAVLNALSATGIATYNTSTGVFNVTTTGNWAGTLQNKNPSDFLSSSTVYVATFNGSSGAVTGVGSLSNNSVSGGIDFSAATGTNITGVLHSLAISQFTGNIVNTFNGATGTIVGVNSVNGATGTVSFGYVSSFNGATGTITGVNSVNGATGTVVFGYVATNTGNWAGTWKNLNTTDFLSSSTVYLATNTGNWAGTWQGYGTSTFLATTTASTTYVPYTGANADINLGSHNVTTTGGVSAVSMTSTNSMLTNASATNALYANQFTNNTAKNALVKADANGLQSAYGGASGCAAGNAVTTISSLGATTCAPFVTTSSIPTVGGIAYWSSATQLTSTNTPVFAVLGTLNDISSTVSGVTTTIGEANSGVSAGSCTNCNLTINAKGKVTAQANGTGGSGSAATTSPNNMWIPWTQTVTSTASGTIGITDASNGSSSQNIFRKGRIVKWLYNGVTSTAMVTTSTYANGVTIANIEGDQANTTMLTTSSFDYGIQMANSFTLQYAGGIGATASNTFGNYFAPVDMKMFGCDAYVGTAGTGGGTTFTTNYITGASTENYICPSLALSTGTSTVNNAATTTGGWYTQTVSSTQIIVADVNATNTTASAVDGYITNYYMPYWNIAIP
jgi:hypothetical protein